MKEAPLTTRKIRAWARLHHQRIGRWLTPRSRAVAGVSGGDWRAIDRALVEGLRGLPPGGSLAELLRRMGARKAKPGPKPKRPPAEPGA
jgi:hypothetical protein